MLLGVVKENVEEKPRTIALRGYKEGEFRAAPY